MSNDIQLDAQVALLGAMLNWENLIGPIVAKVNPEDFTEPNYRTVYLTIREMFLSGKVVDPVTVVNALNDTAGGKDWYEFARQAMLLTPTGANWEAHAEIIQDQGRLVRERDLGMIIATSVTRAEVAKAVEQLNALQVTRSRVTIIDAAQAALDFYSRQGEAVKPEYLRWGMKELDEVLYAELGDFVVVGGYPSAGKTLLSIQFALQMASKYRVGYFSLETSPKKLVDRIMSHMAQVPLSRIKRRELTEADWGALSEAASKLASLHFDCIDAGGMSVQDIQAIALTKRYQVIVVDYLQLVADSSKGRYEQVTNISQGLHTLARSNAITVIALAQLRRPDKENGKPKPPTMADFRESGQIEQDADIALLLWPTDPNDNHSRRVLKVGKNKDGDRTKLELDFDGSIQTMKPAVPTPGEQYRKTQQAIAKAAKEAKAKKADQQMTLTELTDPDPNLPF